MACFPCVRLRKVTAIRRRNGSCARRSWMRPNDGAERRGKGIEETTPPGDGGDRGDFNEVSFTKFSRCFRFSIGPAFEAVVFLGVMGAFLT